MGSIDSAETADVQAASDFQAALEQPFHLHPGWTSGAKALNCALKVSFSAQLSTHDQPNQLMHRMVLRNQLYSGLVQF